MEKTKKMDFKDMCLELVQQKRDLVEAEFDRKKSCSSMKEAYPNTNERIAMRRLFKAAGLFQKSWRRSIGALKTTDAKTYRKQWNDKNKHKNLLYNYKYLKKKFDPVTATVTTTAVD